MKSIFRSIAVLAAVALSLAACGGAQAQSVGPQDQAQFVTNAGPVISVDLSSLRYVNVNPGASSITDRNGVVVPGHFVNASAFTFSEAAKGFSQYSPGIYQGRATTSCANGFTLIAWETGPESINDSCSRYLAIMQLSRR